MNEMEECDERFKKEEEDLKEEKINHQFLPSVSVETCAESCQVFIKEEVEDESLESIPAVHLRKAMKEESLESILAPLSGEEDPFAR